MYIENKVPSALSTYRTIDMGSIVQQPLVPVAISVIPGRMEAAVDSSSVCAQTVVTEHVASAQEGK